MGSSLVMANAYAITHDVSVYAEPDMFNPDRYLPIAEGGAGEPLPVGHFGFGRRYDKASCYASAYMRDSKTLIHEIESARAST